MISVGWWVKVWNMKRLVKSKRIEGWTKSAVNSWGNRGDS